jgi:hypothetical protein
MAPLPHDIDFEEPLGHLQWQSSKESEIHFDQVVYQHAQPVFDDAAGYQSWTFGA